MTSRPLVFPTAMMMTGMSLASIFDWTHLWGVFAVVMLVSLVMSWFFKTYRKPLLLLACLFFGGLWMMQALSLPRNHISRYYEQFAKKTIACQGRIVSAVEWVESGVARSQKFTMRLEKIKLNQGWQTVQGKVLARSFSPISLQMGDRIITEAKLFFPYEQKKQKTSYREYLKQKDIYFSMSIQKKASVKIMNQNQVFSLQENIVGIFQKLKKSSQAFFSQEESAMLEALVLGDKKDIPKMIRDLFAKTGTAHLLAVSGFHVGIVAMVTMLILKLFPLPWRCRFVLAIVFLIFYALLTGMMPSVLRATVMACIVLSGYLLEREVDPLNSLACAALVILLMAPLQIFDIGFQLSFSCVLAILLCSFLWPIPAEASPIQRWLLASAGVSLSASIGSLGIGAYYFEYVSTISLLSNMIIVPLMGLVTLMSICFFLFLWSPLLLNFFVIVLKVLIHFSFRVVLFFSEIPGGYYETKDISFLKIILFYLCLGAGILLLWMRKKLQQRP